MPYEIKTKTHKCYSVINSETGKVHAKCTSKKKAEAQIRLLENLPQDASPKDTQATQGEGVIEDLFNQVWASVRGTEPQQVIDKLSFKKRAPGKLPPKSRKLLEVVGNETINKLVVVRTPIESYINRTLQLVSLGAWQDAVKKAGYDKLFHLSLFINDKFVLHKIEATTFVQDNPIKANSETMEVPLGAQPRTINELIDNTRKAMGEQKFTDYDARDNNCQVFIDAVLSSNGLNSPDLKKFVLQDSVKIFESTPSWTGKFARFITDLGARANRLIEGEGPKEPKVAKRQPSKWVQALKMYQQNTGVYCIPRRGSKEYDAVKKIMMKM